MISSQGERSRGSGTYTTIQKITGSLLWGLLRLWLLLTPPSPPISALTDFSLWSPGPRLFLSCPIDVDGSRVWFTDLWNYSIIPYLLEAVREGLQVRSTLATGLLKIGVGAGTVLVTRGVVCISSIRRPMAVA